MKKGCGMKMAKGGSVKKMSPRKAMAMGKKPSGGKSGVKKFAAGGPVVMDKGYVPKPAVMGRPDPLDKNLRPEFNGGAMPRRPVTGGPLILPNRPIRGQEIMPGTMPPTKSGLGRISVNPVRRAFAKGGSVKKGCKK